MDVFISYSSKDREWKDRISQHLEQMRMARVLDFASWDDSNINVGEGWDQVIKDAIGRARVALLLISSDFLTSTYIVENEIPEILKRADDGELVVVPLMVRPSAWTRFEWLAQLEHFPKDGALSGMSDFDVESRLTELVEELARLVEQSKLVEETDGAGDTEADGFENEAAVDHDADKAAEAPNEFLTEPKISELIRNEYRTEPLGMVRIFHTNSQRTWMVAIPGAIVCLLDDKRTRGTDRVIQWREYIDPLTRVTVTRKAGKRMIGHVGVGRKQRWLASLKDFEDSTENLQQALTDLVARARN